MSRMWHAVRSPRVEILSQGAPSFAPSDIPDAKRGYRATPSPAASANCRAKGGGRKAATFFEVWPRSIGWINEAANALAQDS